MDSKSSKVNTVYRNEDDINLDCRKLDLEKEVYPTTPEPVILNRYQACECCLPVGNPVFTGFFRDGIRRIDLVLVSQDSTNDMEKAKLEFLMSAINTGLELEMEPGVHSMHQHMLFIKVHAPDALIEEYGHYYDAWKVFKLSHVEYIQENRYILEYIMPHLRIQYEKEWIKLARMQFPGPLTYSTLERSLVTYKILQTLTFGKPENYYGIDRLLAHNVFLDAYPLHDGPYFFLELQDRAVFNARQVLFYNWVGYKNMFRSQPLNLIREYMGERIAFFFAFFEFYMRWLVPAALIGVVVFGGSFFVDFYDDISKAACEKHTYNFSMWDLTYGPVSRTIQRSEGGHRVSIMTFEDFSGPHTALFTDFYTISTLQWRWWPPPFIYSTAWYYYWFDTFRWVWKNEYHYAFVNKSTNELPVCPACRNMYTCPFKNLSDYCPDVAFKIWIDNPYSIAYAFFISTWGILLYLFWRRKEFYLCWLWEASVDTDMNTIRPEYRVEHKKSTLTGMRKVSAVLVTFLMRLVLTTSVIVTYVFGVIPALIALTYFIQTEIRGFDETLGFRVVNYMALTLVSMINAFVILIIEKVVVIIAYKFVSYMNHRTEDTYEKCLVVKMYGFSFLVNFSFIFFMAFVKGQLYTYPADPDRWYIALGLGVMNCGPLSCISEVWVTVIVTILAKKMFAEAYNILSKNVTDYNQGKSVNQRLPCWEKEFMLKPVTEQLLMSMYRDLLIQMADCTMFVFVMPLAPLFALVVNIWEIRHFARKLLLRSRRPMLFKSWGLGSWRIILMGLPYAASAVNMLTISLNSVVFDATVYKMYFNHTRFFMDYAMGVYNSTDYNNMTGPGSPHDEYDQAIRRRETPPPICIFPGKWNRRVRSYKMQQVIDNSYTMTMGKWYVNWYQAIYFAVSQHMIIIIGLILHHVIEQQPDDIQETMMLEHIVKTYKRPSEKKEK